MTNLRPVVLSGGSGTRLWPLSTLEVPKQFLPLFDGRTLFELTLRRLDGLGGLRAPVVVTGSAHVELARAGLADAGVTVGNVVVEPTGRNTAPAAIAAALVADPTDILVIVPSDHLITDVAGFQEAVDLAARHATRGGIITFGIEPTRPDTGYGYIEIGEPLGDGAFGVRRFKEKPDQTEADKLVADGRHVWNSGIFVARADHVLDEGLIHCPGIVEGVSNSLPPDGGDPLLLGDSFEAVEAISFDYAIMEKTDRATVVPIDVGWDDVGSYQSLFDAVERDKQGNHIEGEVTTREVSGSLVVATSRKVAVAGLEGVVVVETPDAVLVVPLDRSQEVRDLAGRADGQ